MSFYFNSKISRKSFKSIKQTVRATGWKGLVL